MKTLQPCKFSESLSGWRGGDGPAMVMIHGVGLRSEAWSRMVPDLAKHFSLILIDLPGHGRSPCFKQQPALQDFTIEIAHVLNTLDDQAIIVGHSMGALIALDLAVSHPGSVSAVAPLNAIHRRTQKAKTAVIRRAREIEKNGPSDPSPTLERWFGKYPKGASLTAADECRNWLTSVNPIGYAHAYSVFAEEDGPSDDQLGTIKCPALVVTGSDEPNSTPQMSQAIAERLENGKAIIIKNARHMMPMTHGEIVSKHLINTFAHGKNDDA